MTDKMTKLTKICYSHFTVTFEFCVLKNGDWQCQLC